MLEAKIRSLEHELSIYRQTGNQQAIASRLEILGDAHLELEEDQEAIKCYEEALNIYCEIKDLYGEGRALKLLGYAHHLKRELDKAEEFYGQALAIFRKYIDKEGEAFCLSKLSDISHDIGTIKSAFLGLRYIHFSYHLEEINREKVKEAMLLCQQALTIYKEINNRREVGNCLAKLAYGYHELKEKEKAIKYCKQALTIFEEIDPDYVNEIVELLMLVSEVP